MPLRVLRPAGSISGSNGRRDLKDLEIRLDRFEAKLSGDFAKWQADFTRLSGEVILLK
jgi:hypothetical protein